MCRSAPDGSAAVYCGNRDSSGLIKFNFNTGAETPLVDDGGRPLLLRTALFQGRQQGGIQSLR